MVDPVRRGAAGVLHYCCTGGDRYRLGPAGGSVNDGEQVGKTFGCRQGAHHVHVDMAESAGGYVLRRCLHMAVDLGPLAAQASLRPGGDVCGETFPHIPGGDEAAGRPPARVGVPMEMFAHRGGATCRCDVRRPGAAWEGRRWDAAVTGIPRAVVVPGVGERRRRRRSQDSRG